MDKKKLTILIAVILIVGIGITIYFVIQPPENSEPIITDVPWPEDLELIWLYNITDPLGDFENVSEIEGPQTIIPYPPCDILSVKWGIHGEFFYLQVEYADIIPNQNVSIQSNLVHGQSMSVAFDTDNNSSSGTLWGVEVFFAVGYIYEESSVKVYAGFDFLNEDIHSMQRSEPGELGFGGIGYDYVIVRYNLTILGDAFPGGYFTPWWSWSEAESDIFHHFALDELGQGNWSCPDLPFEN